MNEKVELGDRVQDKISGMKGIAVGATEWLYACRRISVQPEEAKDGKPIETFCVDEPQLKILKKAVIVPPKAAAPKQEKTGGTRPDAGRRADVMR